MGRIVEIVDARLGASAAAQIAEIAAGAGGLLEIQTSGRGLAVVAGCRIAHGAEALARAAPDAGDTLEVLGARASDWGLKRELESGEVTRLYGRGDFAAADVAALARSLDAPSDLGWLERWSGTLSRGSIAMIGARLGAAPQIAAYLSLSSVPASRAALVGKLASLEGLAFLGPTPAKLASVLDRDRDESVYLSLAPAAPSWVKLDVGARTLDRAESIAADLGLALPRNAEALYADGALEPSHLSARFGAGASVAIYFRERRAPD